MRIPRPLLAAASLVPATLAAGLVLARAPLSADVYWSQAVGRAELAHGVYTHDHLTYTLAGHAVVSTEWLYDLYLAAMAHVVGVRGANLLDGLLALAGVVAYLLARGVRGGRLGWLAFAGVVLLLPDLVQGRALSLSFALFGAELALLTLARRRPVLLAALPPLLALWLNLHGTALLGLAVLALEAVLSAVPRRWLPGLVERSAHRRPLVLALAASALALGATPWGFGLALHDLRLSESPLLARWILEWEPPPFQNPLILAGFAGVLVLLAIALWRRRGPALEVALAVVLLGAAARSARLSEYLAIVALALAATVDAPRPGGRFFSRGPIASAIALGLAAALALGPVAPALGVSGATPPGALAALDHHPTGRLFTTFTWADDAELHGHRAFVDGRLDLFLSDGLFAEFMRVYSLSIDPDPLLTRYGVRYVLWPARQPLAVFLGHDPRWRRAARGPGWVLFARSGVGPGSPTPTVGEVGGPVPPLKER